MNCSKNHNKKQGLRILFPILSNQNIFSIEMKNQNHITMQFWFSLFGPSDWIRTSGLLNPIQARYQTSPHPELFFFWGVRTLRLLVGASDEARTRYLHLGKVALYQMSYTRNGQWLLYQSFCKCQPFFWKSSILFLGGNATGGELFIPLIARGFCIHIQK